MAQRPWEVLGERRLSVKETVRFLERHAAEAELASELSADRRAAAVFDANAGGVFKRLRCRGLAQLRPAQLQDPAAGVREFLAGFRFAYIPEFLGIWLAARAEPGERGWTCDAEQQGVIVFHINVDVLVFAPLPGTNLAGRVTQIDGAGLVCSVMKSFRAVIPADRLLVDSELVPHPTDEAQNTLRVGDKTVRVGSRLKFIVLGVRGPELVGSLRPLRVKRYR